MYADDNVLFAHNLKSIQNAISALQSNLRKLDCKLEPSETEFLVANNSQLLHRSIRQGYRKFVIKILLITLGYLSAQLLQPCNIWYCQMHRIKILKDIPLLVRVKGRLDKLANCILYEIDLRFFKIDLNVCAAPPPGRLQKRPYFVCDWKRASNRSFQLTCDELASKIRVPFDLLMIGSNKYPAESQIRLNTIFLL